MVDAMTRPFNSWGNDFYAPRHALYYSQDQNPPTVRLPPPSSLIGDAHRNQTASTGRERAFHDPAFYRDVYAPVASMPGRRPAQVPILGPEGGGPVDTRVRLSPAQSSTVSDRSEDPSDYPRPPQFTQENRSSPTSRLSSLCPTAHERPLRQPSCAETQLMRPSHDTHPPNARPGNSSQASSPAHQAWSPFPEPRAPEQRMKIAGLLSNDQNSDTSDSSKAVQKAPQRIPTSAAVTSTYRINIRQQPIAARSCGYGERDRRVIDPPPIIQMSIVDPTASPEEIRNRLTHSYSIMHCTIWNEAGDQDLSSMPEDYRTQRRLMGTVVSSPFAGNDENDEFGCFFCFPDLSCRTPGSFRLQFSFMVLDPFSSPGHRTPVAAIVMSDVFTVYNAKDFPGMKASTALTKRLKEQGCLISIKKGNDRTRVREGSESGEDEYEEDAQGGTSQRRSKRPRKS
ncbi:hypothetical protein RRF57_005311 [Xylaria bambusicola]|uniref:Velvet domain-containing protein n=1 Tax=Xylaria bambusicola TaxID=326684 RepID=A0AAN7UNB4_9PEZI